MAASVEGVLADPFFPSLKAYIVESTGLAYYAQRDADLAGRIQRRMLAVNLVDCQSYHDLLRHPIAGEAEHDTLVADLTIGETYFFRYTEQFAGLRDVVLPELIRRNRQSRRLRIWSAGCATGPEPYSVSILLRRDMAAQLAGWDITIMGTDINRDFLARARRGDFPGWAFRGVADDILNSCFSKQGDVRTIAPRYREGVHFQYHNLVRHPFPSAVDDLWAFDLILCRNVFIYFDVATFRRMVSQLEKCLVDGGWLLVGHAESNIELFRAFRTVTVPGATLYQKSKEAAAEWFPAPTLPQEAPQVFPLGPPPVEESLEVDLAPLHDSRPLTDLATVWSYINRGSWEAAERHCRQLLAVNRLDAAVHFSLALILEQRGQTQQSEQCLRHSLYLDRNFILAHYHLGMLLQRQGDRDGAARSFRNSLRLLEGIPRDRGFPQAPGLTAANLQELASMHLELLQT